MQYALQIRRLVVQYGARRVIDDLDLDVPPGCVYALLGGNGAGKTTTINTLLGFVKPAAGEILIGDCPLAADPSLARSLAYLPENVALYPYMSGVENLMYFCAAAGRKLARSEAASLLSEAGLDPDFHDARSATYSKGMRQKVGLAVAYARNAVAMLLDEPTSGLDPAAANDFANQIRTAGGRGIAVLMATHDLFNAKQVADRIGIMKQGRLVAEVSARDIGHPELEELYLEHARAAA
jgi:ABC-2 type transport system ATP-binding protein